MPVQSSAPNKNESSLLWMAVALSAWGGYQSVYTRPHTWVTLTVDTCDKQRTRDTWSPQDGTSGSGERERTQPTYTHMIQQKTNQGFVLKINSYQKYHWKLLFLCWKAPPSCSLSFHCEYWQRDNGPMAAPGIPRLWPRLGEAELELVLCPRTMGGTMGAGPASILLPLSLWGQRRPGFVLDCEGQCDGQSRGWCPARLVSAPLLHSDIPVIIFSCSTSFSFCSTKTDQNNQSWQLLYEN